MKPTPCMTDLSHNDKLPYSTYAADREGFVQMVAGHWPFLMHKLSQGSSFIDPTVVGRLAQAAQVPDLNIGVYHFMDDSPIHNQIGTFMGGLMKLGAALPAGTFLRLMVDNEPQTLDLPVTARSDALANMMAQAMFSATGRHPLVYGNRYNFFSARSIGFMAACPLLLAKYGPDATAGGCPPGWVNWQWQQFSDGTVDTRDLSVPGFTGVALDMSEFAGSLAEAIQTWRL